MENDMRKVKQTEALHGKQSLISPEYRRAFARAHQVWGDIDSTNSGKLAILEAAHAGENSAQLILLEQAMKNGKINKIFWKSVGYRARARIEAGENELYSNTVFEAIHYVLGLKGAKDEKGADLTGHIDFEALRQDIKNNKPGCDPYLTLVMRVAWVMITKTTELNTKQNRGGMTGKADGEMRPSATSLEAQLETYGDSGGGYEGFESRRDPFTVTDGLSSWRGFVKDPELDSGPSPTPRKLLKYFLKQSSFDVTVAAAKFGKTNMTIRTRLSSMKEILEKHEISQILFNKILISQGSEELAKLL